MVEYVDPDDIFHERGRHLMRERLALFESSSDRWSERLNAEDMRNLERVLVDYDWLLTRIGAKRPKSPAPEPEA